MSVISRLFIAVLPLTLATASADELEYKQPSSSNKTEEIRRLPGKEMLADFRGVAKVAIPAVVAIKVQGTKAPEDSKGEAEESVPGGDLWNFFSPKKNSKGEAFEGQASGAIVSPDGHVLTNSHVVHGMDSIIVQLDDGREFPAKVLGDDPNSDLALVKIDAKDLPHLTLGNSDNLEVGQWVAAIGNPYGLRATLTVGVVSAKCRNNLDIASYEDFIQTDAAINRGNSGGPLLALSGEIVGINTAIATTNSSGYIGIGFAIPSNMAKVFMDEILTDGKLSRGFLGVRLQSLDYPTAKAYGLRNVAGAIVANVNTDSAAAKAGLKEKDVILRLNDRPIENAAYLRNAVYMMKPGSRILLTVLRDDKTITVPVIVGSAGAESAVVTPIVDRR